MARLGEPWPWEDYFVGKWADDWDAAFKDEAEAFNQLKTEQDLIAFPMADGAAWYVVASERPLVLRHVPVGDSWQIPYAHIRGLRLADVKDIVHRRRTLAGTREE